MIYTSYFAKLDTLPKNMLPISISLTQPKGICLQTAAFLKPTWDILNDYKQTHDEQKYIDRYNNEILSKLDPVAVYNYLTSLNSAGDVVLICYESSEKFCHRHLVAKWFRDNAIPCDEFVGVK